MDPVSFKFSHAEALIPYVLQGRLELETINASVKALGEPLGVEFDLPLDVGIVPTLKLQVLEHEHSIIDAYRGFEPQLRPKAKARAQPSDIYNLPLSISADSLAVVDAWRQRLEQWAVDDGWPLFEEGSFVQDILAIISQYWRPDLETHQPLRVALEVSAYMHVLSTAFTVPDNFVPMLDKLMHNPPEPGHEWYASKVVNSTIKSRIFPQFKQRLGQLAHYLGSRHEGAQNLQWSHDLNICVGFVLTLYFGNTQVHLWQVVEHGEVDRSVAVAAIQELDELVSILHRQQPSTRALGTDASELHAIEFDLTRKIKEVVEKHARRKPKSLKLDLRDPGRFKLHNSERACWMFALTCIGEKTSKRPGLAWSQIVARLLGSCMRGELEDTPPVRLAESK
ncbi:hypothetical protein LTS08_008824 [Lithohypha guttulata]|nr:hypothetical protein LTS08_008824 [Lithohypha guttulata]